MARNLIVKAQGTPTIQAASYVTGNAIGGLLTFSNAANGGFAKLLSAVVLDKANQKIACDLLLFSQTFTATSDKSAIAISAADLANMIGVISFSTGDWVSAAASTNAIATKYNLNLAAIGAIDNNLYGQLVARGSATYVSTSDITVKVFSEVFSE